MAAALLGGAPARGARQLGIYFSPVSPLQLGGEVSDALLVAAKAGAICRILPAPTAGTTGPAALSAALAQQHAEVLAGVVAVQATCPGTPCTYGARLHTADPRTGAAVWGTPALGVCAAGATLLARRRGLACDCYGLATDAGLVDVLACDCYGLATDAGVVDVQNGYERALNGLLGALARPRYLSGVGGLFSVAAAGLEQIEIDDEILGSILFALEERPWDAEALDAGALAEGVRAGSFLGVRQTRTYLRREACSSTISRRGVTGGGGVLEAAEARMLEHLAAGPVGLPDGVEAQLCALIDGAAVVSWPTPGACSRPHTPASPRRSDRRSAGRRTTERRWTPRSGTTARPGRAPRRSDPPRAGRRDGGRRAYASTTMRSLGVWLRRSAPSAWQTTMSSRRAPNRPGT